MSDSENEESNLIDPLDLFIFDESNRIIDLHEDLKNRVPYFFGNTSLPLYNFLLDHISNSKEPKGQNLNEYFIHEFNKEIQVTLYTVNQFLINRRKRFKCVELKDWQVFCYENFT